MIDTIEYDSSVNIDTFRIKKIASICEKVLSAAVIRFKGNTIWVEHG